VREGLEVIDFCLEVPSGDAGKNVYVDCEAYGTVVDYMEGFVEGGETITVEGRIAYRSWTDSRGVLHSGKIIIVDEVEYDVYEANYETEEDESYVD
jgi:single-stranded DNA-binding protein